MYGTNTDVAGWDRRHGGVLRRLAPGFRRGANAEGQGYSVRFEAAEDP